MSSVPLPKPSAEQRESMVKLAHQHTEKAKQHIRYHPHNHRPHAAPFLHPNNQNSPVRATKLVWWVGRKCTCLCLVCGVVSRKVRRDGLDKLKNAKDSVGEDEIRRQTKNIETLTVRRQTNSDKESWVTKIRHGSGDRMLAR